LKRYALLAFNPNDLELTRSRTFDTAAVGLNDMFDPEYCSHDLHAWHGGQARYDCHVLYIIIAL